MPVKAPEKTGSSKTPKRRPAKPKAPTPAHLTFQERLDRIRETKLKHTEIKRRHGPRDNDDWGQVPLTTPFRFVPQTDHPKGYVMGARDCGRNFRRFLESCPTYVDPMSSLLGGFYVTFNSHVAKWDPENYWNHLVPEQRKYNIIHGIDSSQHFLPDICIGFELGFGGLLEKIAKYRGINTSGDQGFYDGLESLVLGIQNWIRNHVEAARRMAEMEPNPQLRQDLEEMAEINVRLATDPPRTFREGCQWLAWYQMAKRMYIGGGSLGRIDQALYPYYQREKEAGRLTDEEAIFHLACLLVKDAHYIQLGGVDPDGADVANPVSFLVLEAAHRIRIPANIAVVVHEGMDKALMRKAVELLFLDKLGIPRFCGLKGMVEGFARNGFPIQLARRRVQAGCHWFCLPGTEYCFSDVIKINFACVLDAALHEMLGDRAVSPSVADLWSRFQKHLRRAVEVTAEGIDLHMEYKHLYYPELALDLLCHGPIEKGVDASHGGVEYTNIGVDGAALATVADSFAAMALRIENERSVTWNELSAAINEDWKGFGKIRLRMQNVPSYGRGGTAGDDWADRISQCFTQLVKEKPTPAGHRMIPGFFSWASTLEMGKATAATPDGRKAGEPISFGANPNPGRLRGGPLTPTSMAIAIARIQPGYGNSAPFQMDVDPGLVQDEDGIEKFEALIRGHFELGGTLINANVLDKDAILEAYKDPSTHPDLIVRVTGFSAYFASLSPEFRKLVYDRIVALEQ